MTATISACSPTLTAALQASVNEAITLCSNFSSNTNGVVDNFALDIIGYSEDVLLLADNATFPIVTVADSKKLQSASLSTAGLSQLTLDNLTDLSSIETQTLAVGGNLTLQNLPSLTNVSTPFDSPFLFGNLSLQDIGNSQLSTPLPQTLLFAQQNTAGDVSVVRCNTPHISFGAPESLQEIYPHFFSPHFGNIVFSNPPAFSPFQLDLDQVQDASSLLLNNVANVSLSGLESVNGDLTISNSSLTSVNGGNLTKVSGDILLENLPALSGFPFTALDRIRSLTITNTGIKSLSLPVSSASADISISGAISRLEFPFLKQVSGRIDINSTDALNCTSLHLEEFVAEGNYTCNGSVPPTNTSSPHTGGQAKNARVKIAVGSVFGVLLLLGVAAAALLMWRRRRRKQNESAHGQPVLYEKAELEYKTGPVACMVESGGGSVLELPGSPRSCVELDGAQKVELAGSEGKGKHAELDSGQKTEVGKL